MTGKPGPDALQPIIFSVLAGLTPAQVELEFHDQMKTRLPEVIEADAIALSVETFSARTAYELADRHRELGIPVILGGYHPSACPDEAAEHADAIVLGDAEDTWPDLLRDLAMGSLKRRYVSGNDQPMQSPKQGIFSRGDYPPLSMVQFSRGCRYACEFCSIHSFYGTGIRTKTIPQIVAEIAENPQKLLFFTDDNLFADRARAVELFEALIPLGKRWICQISMDVARDPELLALMRRAGALMVLIGFESLERANLKQMGKGANLAGDYEQVITNIHAAGLMIYGTFVIGYDHDTTSTAPALVDFATRNGFSVANFNPLMPMPDTRLFERMAVEDRLLHPSWWLDEGFRYGDAMFRPAGMTPEELTSSCRDARYRFYSRRSMFVRARGHLANPMGLGVHFVANSISRRAIHAKQGAALGVGR